MDDRFKTLGDESQNTLEKKKKVQRNKLRLTTKSVPTNDNDSWRLGGSCTISRGDQVMRSA